MRSNTWVVFDPFTNSYRAYDLDRWNKLGLSGYVSPPGTPDEARAARIRYEASRGMAP